MSEKSEANTSLSDVKDQTTSNAITNLSNEKDQQTSNAINNWLDAKNQTTSNAPTNLSIVKDETTCNAFTNLSDGKNPTTSEVQTEGQNSPLDRGWAWVVMFGAFVNITVFMTFMRSSSLLYILFLERYKESATLTSMTLMFYTTMFALCNIVGTAVLYKRFKVRTLAVSGATINFLSILIIAFAPNIFLICVMMACVGFSHGLIAVPQITLVGSYFKKHLSFATAFVSLGLSVATIAGPPLTQILLDKYGLQGAIIILAGINLNCVPASMLFRPVSQISYLYVNGIKETEPLLNRVTNGNIELPEEENEIKESKHERSSWEKRGEVVPLIRSQSDEQPAGTKRISDTDECDELGVMSKGAGTSCADINVEIPQDKENIANSFIDKISLSSSIRYLSDINLFVVDSIPKNEIQTHSKICATEKISANVKTAGTSRVISVRKISKESLHQADSKQTWFTKVRQSIKKSIYLHPLAILLLLTSGFGTHTQVCVAYMPVTGKENGLTSDQVPYLVTVIGISDLFAKLAVGFIADLGYMKPIHIVCIAQFISGTILQFVGFFKSFGLMIVLQIGLGFTISIMYTLLAAMSVDLLGLQHLGHIMSGYFLINGMVMSADHVVIGSLKDLTGSFVAGYNFIGSLILLSAVVLLLEPLVAKYKSAKV